MLCFVKVAFPFELSRILDPEKITDWKVWKDLYCARPDNSKEFSTEDTSLSIIPIRSVEHIDFAVVQVLSSAQLIISLNKSITAPVGWLPLQAYLLTCFSVASISFTDGLLWSPLDNIIDISPLTLYPCVWYIECCNNNWWSRGISRCRDLFLSHTMAGLLRSCFRGDDNAVLYGNSSFTIVSAKRFI